MAASPTSIPACTCGREDVHQMRGIAPVQIRRPHIGLPRCGRHVRRLRRNHPLKRAATGFPVFPVEQGIFSILSDKCRYGAENGRPNQAVARQFPLRLKRELNPVNREFEQSVFTRR